MKPSTDLASLLAEISSLIGPGRDAYLVGGAVRDLLLDRGTCDIDLTVTGDTGEFARKAAGRLGGVFFALDAERGVHRVAVKGGPSVQLDVSPLKGDILGDLAARDFTINAMAIKVQPSPPTCSGAPHLFIFGGFAAARRPLPQGERGEGRAQKPLPLPLPTCGGGKGGGEPVRGGLLAEVIDPFGGMSDISARRVRALGRGVFMDDPLRLIRAFRISSQLGFEIEGETLSSIKELAPLISGASPERVRDETYLILEGLKPSSAFRRMSEAGLLCEIIKETGAMAGIPQGEPHVYDLLEHSLKAMEHAEEVMRDTVRYFGGASGKVDEYLNAAVDGGLRMSGLVKLAAFLHDVGKPRAMRREGDRIRFIGHDEEGAKLCEGVAARLKLSSRASETLAKSVRHHMRPLHLSQGPVTMHALYRYVRDMGDDLPASLVVSLADAIATRERPDAWVTDVEGLVKAASSYYYGDYRKAVVEPLINGRDLMTLFGLKPGPVFKKILDDVREKRAEGALTSRDEAIAYVRENMARFI